MTSPRAASPTVVLDVAAAWGFKRGMRTFVLAPLALGLLLVGCGSDNKPPHSPASVQPAERPTTTTAAAPPQTGDRQRAGSVTISNEIARLCNITLAAPTDAPSPHFDYDSADVDDAEKALLQQVAKCFTTGPLKGRTMKLTGRADPRGEQEYNMTLGAKRSNNVKAYLQGLGVGPNQMQSTSRGELDATGTDEAGWKKDRRVDIDLAS